MPFSYTVTMLIEMTSLFASAGDISY